MKNNNYTILVLAAGMGSRLRPYTTQTPKSILDINVDCANHKIKLFKWVHTNMLLL